LDSAGNLYIADCWNHRIRKVSPDGTITTVAGTGTPGFAGDGGPASSALLAYPHGVKADTAGNLYIADTNNQRIRRVSPNGIITTVAGSGSSGFSGDGGPATGGQLDFPYDVAADTSGNLYIADQGNYRIRKVDRNGIMSTECAT
jgi:sugar lactone lactonase YvrE